MEYPVNWYAYTAERLGRKSVVHQLTGEHRIGVHKARTVLGSLGILKVARASQVSHINMLVSHGYVDRVNKHWLRIKK